MIRRALLVAVLGCKSKAETPPDPAPPPKPAIDAAVQAPPDAAVAARTPDAAPAPPGGLAGREDGVGPIVKGTAFTRGAIAKLFPGYEVKNVSVDMGGDLREKYIGVSKGRTLVLKIEGDDTVRAVHIVGPDVPNSLGAKLGATYAEVVKAIGPLDCQDAGEDTDWRDRIAVCDSEKSSRYSLDFADGFTSGKQLLEQPALLAKATLVAVTWIAEPIVYPGQ